MAAISLVDGKITHDAVKCIGCGRCVTVCPKRAVTPEIDDLEEAIREMTERIGKLADVA